MAQRDHPFVDRHLVDHRHRSLCQGCLGDGCAETQHFVNRQPAPISGALAACTSDWDPGHELAITNQCLGDVDPAKTFPRDGFGPTTVLAEAAHQALSGEQSR